MITSSDDRNALLLFANITLFLSVVLSGVITEHLSIFIPSIDTFASLNVFLLVSILLTDKYESPLMILLHTVIYGVVFDLCYTNSIGIFTLYVSAASIIASFIMNSYSNTIFVRVIIILFALFFKDMYVYVIYYIVGITTFSFDEVLIRMIYMIPYNTIVYIFLFYVFSKNKYFHYLTYSNL